MTYGVLDEKHLENTNNKGLKLVDLHGNKEGMYSMYCNLLCIVCLFYFVNDNLIGWPKG